MTHRTPADRSAPTADDLIVQVVARFDALALGLAVGLAGGLVLCAMTLVLVLKGGDPVGPTLALLGAYFYGYSVTVGGSVIGFGYGFLAGFVLGWLTALLHNVVTRGYLYLIRFKANLSALTDVIDLDHSR